MIIVNTETVPGREIEEALGYVKGSTIRAKHLGKDIVSGFRHMVGGEMKDYAEMLTEARQIAIDRMVKDAEAMGADAVVNLRFVSAMVMQGAAEILAYGTAVKLK